MAQSERTLAYLRVIMLAFSAFIFNTTEFMPVALLTDIADSFAMSVEQTGWMITIYAWIVALMSLPLMLLTGKWERKTLLLSLFGLFIASHILSALAWNYWVLLIARMGVAFAHAVFWSITASIVLRVAPKDKQTQALGLLAVGSALAMILGLPMGRIIGQAFEWRTAFGVIGVVASLVMLALFKLLPSLPSENAGSLRSVPELFKRPMLVGFYILTALTVTAHFVAYSYIEPFMLKVVGLSAEETTFALFLFGFAGIVASQLFSRYHNLSPSRFLFISLGLIVAGLACLKATSTQPWAFLATAFLWEIGIAMMSLALQLRVLQVASDATDVAMSMFSGIYNIGIGGGAFLGNLAMKSLGLPHIGLLGAGIATCAVLIFSFFHLKFNKD